MYVRRASNVFQSETYVRITNDGLIFIASQIHFDVIDMILNRLVTMISYFSQNGYLRKSNSKLYLSIHYFFYHDKNKIRIPIQDTPISLNFKLEWKCKFKGWCESK